MRVSVNVEPGQCDTDRKLDGGMPICVVTKAEWRQTLRVHSLKANAEK